MRFLLKSSPTAQVGKRSSNVIKREAQEQTASKAWGQQCSPNCGCVLRFEVQLSPMSVFTASPTVVAASYQAKRVMTTPATSNSGQLKPLMTTHKSLSSKPILTTCSCSTLHALAEQVVEYLPGKSLQTLKNETNLGTVGVRSSIPFRHTVLKDNVLPVLREREKKWNISPKPKLDESGDSLSKFTDTEEHIHCYDLVEDSVLALLHERQIGARKESTAESFSCTMGGNFLMYTQSKGLVNPFGEINDDQNEQMPLSRREAIQNGCSGWLRRSSSPSSYFLFGEDNAAVSTLNYLQYTKDSISSLIFGKSEGTTAENSTELRPSTTYLQLLDMYGNASTEEEMEDDKLDDWVNYVDQIRNQSTTG
jgi:hypothetical protein